VAAVQCPHDANTRKQSLARQILRPSIKLSIAVRFSSAAP
jgi:hypothetical protein